jgi:hypothetical protein
MSANLDLVRSTFVPMESSDFSSVEWAHPEIEFVMAAYRERNDPRTVLLCSVRALHIAVDALVEIAEGDEEDAAEIALSASANVRQVIKWGGDE